MKAIFIRGGRVIDPSQQIDGPANLLSLDGQVTWFGEDKPASIPEDCLLVDASGLVVCPGFIDLHCHLREPGFEDKETIQTGTLAAARGGFTTVCCMPNTEPPIDCRAIVEHVKGKALAVGTVRVLVIGCITKGRRGEGLAEMGEMADAGVVGFSDDGNSVMNSRLLRQAMDYSRLFGLPIIEHCEDKALAEGGQINESIISTRLGLAGIPAAAEESIIARDVALAELTGARLHIAHVSTAQSVDIIRQAKAKGISVTAEATPHHLTLSEEATLGYDTDAKVSPPLRSQGDIEALIDGLKDDVIDIIATDHAPHTEVEKRAEFGSAPFGISGLETAFGSLMSLVHTGKIEFTMLIEKLTNGPAQIIGAKHGQYGTLKVGSRSDIVILDPDKEWTVSPSTFASKGKNTPLKGAKLKGKVVGTICRGEIVYSDSLPTMKDLNGPRN